MRDEAGETVPFTGTRDLGHSVAATRSGSLIFLRVPRRSSARLRAVLADEKKPRLAPLVTIANGALGGVNGDYHGLGDDDYARTYSPLVTDGRTESSWPAREASYASFWLDAERAPHIGTPARDAWLAIGTGPVLLAAGEVTSVVRDEKKQGGWINRLARTAVGFDDAAVFLVATAQEPRAGLSMVGLAEAMKALGCREALNLDGGPSTTLVAKGQLLNVPPGEEGRVNPVASALLVLEPLAGDPGLR